MILLRRVLLVVIFSFLVLAASSDANAACSNPEGNEGEITYKTTYKTMQFCDGNKWWSMKGSISGDSLASKDYVDAAVAAGTSGNYSAPTEWAVTASNVQGNHGADCSSLGAGWRMGSTIDLFHFHMKGVFPDPPEKAWMTILPDHSNLGSSSSNTFYYSGQYGSGGFATSNAENCRAWRSISGYGGMFYPLPNNNYVAATGCNDSARIFCVK